MKTALTLFLALATMATVQAEIFRPGRALAPQHDHDRRDWRSHRDGPTVRIGVNHHPRGYDYGRGYYGYSPYFARSYWGDYGYSYVPSYGYYSGYGYGYPYYGSSGYYTTGSAAGSGLLLGALAGGIIGHNSGDFRHNGWRGAAWGAGAGWLLGSVIDANRRAVTYDSAPVVVQQQTPTLQAQPVNQAPPQQPVTIINNYYNTSTPMSGVNGMFGR